MADTQTPVEKAKARIEQEIEQMRLRREPGYRAFARDAALDAATDRAVASHNVAIEDFKSGRAVDREIMRLQVRIQVADLARSMGRNPNGTVNAPKLPTGDSAVNGGPVKDAETDAATA